MYFETIHQYELTLMTKLHSIKGPLLNQIMLLLDNLDRLPFYYAVLAIAFYAFKQKEGMKLLGLFILTALINQNAKILFAEPRPYQLDPSLGLLTVSFYGFPSGAAQTSAVFCGYIALKAQKAWVWCVCILFLLIVGFSRVYLGVHFPTDILGGWIIGALIVWASYYLLPRLENFLSGKSKRALVTYTLVTALVLALCSLSDDIIIQLFGGVGACLGFICAPALKSPEHLRQKILRPCIALLGLFLIEKISKNIRMHVPPQEWHFGIAAFFNFISGFWFTYGIPL